MTASTLSGREIAALRKHFTHVRACRASLPGRLSPYEELISVATGLTGPGDLAEVEDVMRTGRSGLDDLTPAVFAALAAEAHATWLAIRAALGTVTIEEG
jgi:hypothetical protein